MSSTIPEMIKIGWKVYLETFGYDPIIASFAPGRVNLIGEHIDYNDGFALPMALPIGTIIMGGRNGSRFTADVITLSDKIEGTNRIQFDTTVSKPGHTSWSNYVMGVIYHFGRELPGFNAVIISNIPIGAGLSSSAALEVSMLLFIEQLSGHQVESISEKANICLMAEHTFAGTPCGVMDQTISLNAIADHALLIDFRSLENYQIPFQLKNLAILICNSNVRHKLSDGEYGKRRAECKKALELMNIKSFRDVTCENLKVLHNTKDEILMKRTKHVIDEIQRTKDCAEAIKECDFQKMGKLMTESHASLRDLYEVSCNELDVLVEAANSCPSVLGSRMTGGGFGGSTVTLLEITNIDSVIAHIKKTYKDKCNNEADFLVALPSEAARILKLD